jgi:uncharacterized membrane protein YbhN (UPF0104 family)
VERAGGRLSGVALGSLASGHADGAVLAYRALYYVVPLGGALLLYLGLERYMTTHVPVKTSPPKT